MKTNSNNNIFIKEQAFIKNDPLFKKRRNTSACRIFTYLYNLFIHSGKDPYCSNAHISQVTDIPVSTIKDNLKWLENNGYILRAFHSKTGQNQRAFVILQDQQKIETRTVLSQLINDFSTHLELGRPNYIAMTSYASCYADSRLLLGRSSSTPLADNRPSAKPITVHNIKDNNKLYKKEDRRDGKPIEKTNLASNVKGISSSILKNNSVENKSDSYLPTYQSEEPQTKPQPLQGYLSQITNNLTQQEQQRGIPQYDAPPPSGLNAEETELWNNKVAWGTQRLKSREVKKPFKDVFMKHIEYCRSVPKKCSESGLMKLLETEDDRDYQQPVKYNPRCSVPNAPSEPLPEPVPLSPEEKERKLKEEEEAAWKHSIKVYVRNLIDKNKSKFRKYATGLGCNFVMLKIQLEQAGCLDDKYSLDVILDKMEKKHG